MRTKTLLYTTIFVAVAFFVISDELYAQKRKSAPAGVDVSECYSCHDTIKDLRKMGKHVKVECTNCHRTLKNTLSIQAQKQGPTQIPLGRHADSATRSSTSHLSK
mgnify:CR=1 FL=1